MKRHSTVRLDTQLVEPIGGKPKLVTVGKCACGESRTMTFEFLSDYVVYEEAGVQSRVTDLNASMRAFIDTGHKDHALAPGGTTVTAILERGRPGFSLKAVCACVCGHEIDRLHYVPGSLDEKGSTRNMRKFKASMRTEVRKAMDLHIHRGHQSDYALAGGK